MRIETKAYGNLEIDDLQVIHFPQGILGFEDSRDFALLDAHQKPFLILQSLEDVDTAFILIKPTLFRPDYNPGLEPGDLEAIEVKSMDEVLILSIVTIPQAGPMTANLQGPLFINKPNRKGMQGISPKDLYKTRHDILAEMAELRAKEEEAHPC